MGKQKKKMQDGITLIALVITIIVLLILAGVTISLVLGNNGILTRATKSVEANSKGTAIEQVSMAWSACQTDYLTRSGTEEKSTFFTKEKLNENLGQGEVISVAFEKDANGSELVYKLENKNYTIQIGNDGGVKVKGEGTSGGPSIEDPVIPQEGIGAGDIASSTTCPAVMANDVVVDYLAYTPNDSSKATENGKSTEWQVLYADANNIYLIMKYRTTNPAGALTLSAGVGSNYTTGSAMLSDIETNTTTQNRFPAVKAGWFSKWMDKYKADNTWTSSADNMQAAMYMLDSNLWNTHVFGATGSNAYADWAIGGPTIEMFAKSHGKINGNTLAYDGLSVIEGSAKGYRYNDYLYSSSPVRKSMLLNNSEDYWLVAPSSFNAVIVRYLNSGGACVHSFYSYVDGTRLPLRSLSKIWSQISQRCDNRKL